MGREGSTIGMETEVGTEAKTLNSSSLLLQTTIISWIDMNANETEFCAQNAPWRGFGGWRETAAKLPLVILFFSCENR